MAGPKGEDANARLIAAAPGLLALAHQYAAACPLCDGTGVRQDRGLDPRAGEPCERCADIWAVIDRAEGRA